VALPLPDVPEVTVSHDALSIAVHAQPGAVVTPMVPVPPDDVNDCEVVDNV
jgi:hypothetical protein